MNLKKFTRIEVNSLFTDQNRFKLEINKKKIIGKSPNIWKLNRSRYSTSLRAILREIKHITE